ncbi:hypothetical protein M9H77_15454 [Catharanthus roseus]|uniref:Uncharacterized protein n=1 Tax=Catharanthus roseus TaxID=4058 RepID=A0ACC0AYB0_CATRO|nr:hypothetical protein M9H77_15454 [Catharanthus roseus]
MGDMECKELLEKAKTIRLRTHNGKYLVADDDEKSIRQERDGTTIRAHWKVEFIEDEQNILYLKSCYGKYLTASNKRFLPRITGFKVLQTLPERLNSSLQWEVERNGSRIRLRTRYGQFLRPNSGIHPWRNLVSHDIPFRASSESKLYWELDVVE